MERFGLVATHEPLKLRLLVLPILCGLLLTYFIVNAVNGDQGLRAWSVLAVEIETLQGNLEEISSDRARLERQVALLRPESLDPDLLDERARAYLGVAHPDELTIYRDPK